MAGMSVADAGDPVRECAVLQPMPDLGTDRASPRAITGEASFPRFPGNYKQNAHLLHHSLGKCPFQSLMRERKAVSM